MGTLFWLGWTVCSLLNYGLLKNAKWQDTKRWSFFDESMCCSVSALGIFSFPAILIFGVSNIHPIGLTYRIPAQKALPVSDQKALVKQTGKEQVLTALEIAKQEKIVDEKAAEVIRFAEERRLVLDEQRKVNEAALNKQREDERVFQKEISENTESFSKLLPKLAKKLLAIKPRHIDGFNEEAYQHLDTLIKKKIGIRHKVKILACKVWDTLLAPAAKIDGELALLFIMVAILGFPIFLGSLIGYLIGNGLVGVITGLTILSSLHFYEPLSKRNECKECCYLRSSKFLDKHKLAKSLSIEKVKQLV